MNISYLQNLNRENFLLSQEYLANADIWDEKLWNFFAEKSMHGDEDFNGDAKALNQGVMRGIYLYLHEPEKYDLYNEGWTMGCGWSIETLVEYLAEEVEE